MGDISTFARFKDWALLALLAACCYFIADFKATVSKQMELHEQTLMELKMQDAVIQERQRIIIEHIAWGGK